jgi:hypothetical protein
VYSRIFKMGINELPVIMEILDKNTMDYVFYHYMGFLTEDEYSAFRHYSSTQKLDNRDINDFTDPMVRIYRKKNWLTSDKKILDQLTDGFEAFKRDVVIRIFTNHQQDIFLNYCPVCGQLARTPMAKQCRQGHTW